MSIHILTTDPKLTQQLSQLLEGGQQPFHFYDDLEALISLLPKLRKIDKVFYDLQLEPTLMAFDALSFGTKKTNLIAFEPFEEGLELSRSSCPKTAKHYFVLSSNLRKSGARLKEILHQVDALAVKKKRALTKATAKKLNTAAYTVGRRSATPITLSRYLTSKSECMQRLLSKIAKLAKKPKFVFLAGEDGADFELAAREINFRTNGDLSPLHIADPMRVEIDEIKRKICSKDQTGYCYLGLSYELGILTVARLTDYLERLSAEDLEDPEPCFILGHVDDSEGYLENEVKALIRNFRKLGEVIEIPPLAERVEDVSLIVQSVFTTLRTAHPFLIARMISRGAVEYLETHCADMSYSSLVRIIRNSMALAHCETLTEEEIKNFGDDSPTSQHLVESLADEQYFKDQTGAA
jgi:transcriptional regulator with PAS, ATPase and Fis domain